MNRKEIRCYSCKIFISSFAILIVIAPNITEYVCEKCKVDHYSDLPVTEQANVFVLGNEAAYTSSVSTGTMDYNDI